MTKKGDAGIAANGDTDTVCDVIIIGGGICGCSLLYELSRYQADVILLEKENDVACGTTKANSGIVHSGYDPRPGTDMARFNVEGNALVEKRCADLDVPYRKTGSLVVAFTDDEKKTLEKLLERGKQNGVPGLRLVSGDALFSLEPNLSRDAAAALYAPTAGIVSPWELASAQAECAVEGGARVALDSEVTGIAKTDNVFTVITNKGNYAARYVVNAAGVDADTVSGMAEPAHFRIDPRSGEYFLLDTTEKGLVNTVVFPCPSERGKGVIVAPTVHGNVIVGPDSKSSGRHDVSTTAAGLEYVLKNALRCVPSVNLRASIRNFSGVRAAALTTAGIDMRDFIVGESKVTPGFFNIAGIKSPGLSSAPAIAKEIVLKLQAKGLSTEPNPGFVAKRRVARFIAMSDDERNRAVRLNPLYGNVVCRCESVTEGEIDDALRRPLPPRSLDAVKRRCGAGKGRCQGGFCGPKVHSLIAGHFKIRPEDVPLDQAGTYVIDGETKRGAHER